jgi:hypothetical protein
MSPPNAFDTDPVLSAYFVVPETLPPGWGPVRRPRTDKGEATVFVRGRYSRRIHVLTLAVNDMARRELAYAMRTERIAEARELELEAQRELDAGWQEEE